MNLDDISDEIRNRTEEMTKLLTKLGQKKITEESAYKNIIEKLRQDLLTSANTEEKFKKIEAKNESKAFYIVNDLKTENNLLKTRLKELQNKKIEFGEAVVNVNYANAVNEYKILKEQMLADNENAEQMLKEYKQLYLNAMEENEKLKEKHNEDMRSNTSSYQNEIENYKSKENDYKVQIIKLENDVTLAKNLSESFIEQINKYESINIDLVKENKRLRNEIIDIKGQIRVFCRVRPPLSSENQMYPISMTQYGITIDRNKFLFDEIFNHEAKQDKVFTEVNFLIESVYDGYNSCIFAYGQTGSGKTHTMEGSEMDIGILPRAVRAILENNKKLRDDGWKVKCVINFIEIYNESIRDLLSNEDRKHEIKHENNITYITNCEYICLDTEEQAAELLKFASQNRSVGYTQCNDRSSRSHSIYTFNIELTSKDGKEKKSGTINFIDLAGSERLNESGAQGVRLKETQNINKSLSSLGNVMLSLLRGDSHIPYRNSKLTYYLQNSFSGNARVLMFVNISPEARHVNETLSSLRFAQKVSECKLGASSQNVTKKI